MKQVITHLHGKPKSYRAKVAFSAAAAVTGFIFLVWISTLGDRLAARGELSADNSGANAVAATPFASEELAEQFDTIQGTLNLIRGKSQTEAEL